MFQKIKNSYKIFSAWCNQEIGPLTFLSIFLPFISNFIFSWLIVFIIALVALVFLLYLFRRTIIQHWKISLGILFGLTMLGVFSCTILKKTPKIFNLTEGFYLAFEDKFEGGNYQVGSEKYKWKDKDGHFAPLNDNLSLKTSSSLHQIYPLFQDLRNINSDYILVTDFYLPDSARASIQFMNMQGMDSDQYLGYHFQECVISVYNGTYNSKKYARGYGDYLYERGPKNGTSWNKTDINPGQYTMLVKVSGNKLSCYFQAENKKDYIIVFQEKELKYQNVGGPALSRNVDGMQYIPQVLDFKLYLRKLP